MTDLIPRVGLARFKISRARGANHCKVDILESLDRLELHEDRRSHEQVQPMKANLTTAWLFMIASPSVRPVGSRWYCWSSFFLLSWLP